MLEVKGIKNGIVLDHIRSGRGLIIFNKLFKDTENPVVLLMNVESQILGKKDIIKIENTFDIDLDILALIDQGVTVNIIRDEQRVEKKKLGIPKNIKGILKCQNPRCITHTDDYAAPEFTLVKANGRLEYECAYCEEISEFEI